MNRTCVDTLLAALAIFHNLATSAEVRTRTVNTLAAQAAQNLAVMPLTDAQMLSLRYIEQHSWQGTASHASHTPCTKVGYTIQNPHPPELPQRMSDRHTRFADQQEQESPCPHRSIALLRRLAYWSRPSRRNALQRALPSRVPPRMCDRGGTAWSTPSQPRTSAPMSSESGRSSGSQPRAAGGGGTCSRSGSCLCQHWWSSTEQCPGGPAAPSQGQPATLATAAV